MSDSAKTYTIRVQSDYAYRYSLGETVIPGVVLFSDGNYGLTWDQLQSKLKALPKGTVLR
jgi:hypothetical protein